MIQALKFMRPISEPARMITVIAAKDELEEHHRRHREAELRHTEAAAGLVA